jgi:serine phosphatase RsbU (regulator of sigma subunit)
VGLLVGDVSGQGRDRLAESMLVRHALRTHLRAGLAPHEVIRLAREGLGAELDGELGMVIVAVYDPDAAMLTYASIGDQHPMIVGADGAPSLHAVPSGDGIGADQAVVPLAPGARACLFTTGLSQARVNDAAMGREGVTAIMAQLGPDLTADALVEAVDDRARARPGDMAACVLEPDPDLVVCEAPEAGAALAINA